MTVILQETIRVRGEKHDMSVDSDDVKTTAREALFDKCVGKFGKGKFHIESGRHYWLRWDEAKQDYRYR